MKWYCSLIVLLVLLCVAVTVADTQELYSTARDYYSKQLYDLSYQLFREIVRTAPDHDLADNAQFYSAQCFFSKGDYEHALASFIRLNRDYPSSEFCSKSSYMIGQCLYYMQKHEKAIKQFDRMIDTYPDDPNIPRAYFSIGIAYMALGWNQEALERFVITTNKFPNTPIIPEVKFQIAEAYRRMGDNETALRCLAELLHTENTAASAESAARIVYAIGDIHFKDARYRTAAQYYSRVMNEYPGVVFAPQATIDYVQCSIKLKDWGKAIEALEQFKLQYPQHALIPEVYYLEGKVLYEQGDVVTARRRLRYAFDHNEGNPLIPRIYFLLREILLTHESMAKVLELDELMRQRNPSMVNTVNLQIAHSYLLLTNYQQAINEYTKLLRNPRFDDPDLQSEAFLNRGKAYYAVHEYGKAKKDFELCRQKILRGPRFIEAHFWLGETEMKTGHADTALRYYQFVYRDGGIEWTDRALNGIGRVYFSQQQYADAIVQFHELIERYPDSRLVPDAYYALGVAQYNIGEYTDGVGNLKIVVARYRHATVYSQALYYLGFVLYKSRHQTEAITYFKQYRQEFPDGAYKVEALYYIGWCYFNNRKFNDAHTIFQQLGKEYPSHERAPEALFSAGKCSYNMKKFRQAEEQYLAVYNTYPDTPEAAHATCELANLLMMENNLDAARPWLKRCAGTDVTGVTAQQFYNLGIQYHDSGKYIEAVSMFNFILNNYPQQDIADDAAERIIRSYIAIENYNNALAEIKKFEQRFRDSPLMADVAFSSIKCYAVLQQYKNVIAQGEAFLKTYTDSPYREQVQLYVVTGYEAENNYERADPIWRELTASSDAAVAARALLNLGLNALTRGDYTSALEQFRNTITKNVDEYTVIAQFQTAEILREQGKCSEAIQWYVKVVKDHPKMTTYHPGCIYWTAYCFERQNDRRRAKFYYNKVIADFSESRWARKAESAVLRVELEE